MFAIFGPLPLPVDVVDSEGYIKVSRCEITRHALWFEIEGRAESSVGQSFIS